MPTCSTDPTHVFPAHNKTCPWCEAQARRTPAPTQVALPPVRAPRAPRAAARQPRPVPQVQVNASPPPTAPPLVRRTSRRDAKGSWVAFAKMVAAAVPIWLLTPVVGSFGTLVLPGLSTAVFAPSENMGRTAGDSPETLYIHLAWVLGALCVAILVINLVFGLRARHQWLVTLAGIGGFAGFVWQVMSKGGELWHWDILPICLAASYLLTQLFTPVHSSTKGP